MTIAMVARETLEHNGVTVPVGGVFHTTPIQAAVLRYRRDADFASPSALVSAPSPASVDDVEPSIPDVQATEAPRRRRRKASGAAPRRPYKRRDLAAE